MAWGQDGAEDRGGLGQAHDSKGSILFPRGRGHESPFSLDTQKSQGQLDYGKPQSKRATTSKVATKHHTPNVGLEVLGPLQLHLPKPLKHTNSWGNKIFLSLYISLFIFRLKSRNIVIIYNSCSETRIYILAEWPVHMHYLVGFPLMGPFEPFFLAVFRSSIHCC